MPKKLTQNKWASRKEPACAVAILLLLRVLQSQAWLLAPLAYQPASTRRPVGRRSLSRVLASFDRHHAAGD